MKNKFNSVKLFIMVICLVVLSVLFTLPALAASGTQYETENNDDYDDADIVIDDYDNFGYVSSTDDFDIWEYTSSYTGYANFYLGSIPSGCNYELGILDSDTITVLGEGFKTGNSDELITIPVTANTTYYVMIFTIEGYSLSDSYLFRVKTYPTTNVSVPLYEQQTNYTCSCACARMVMKKYGITISESNYINKANLFISQYYKDDDNNGFDDYSGDKVPDYTYVWIKVGTYNMFLSQYGISTEFTHTKITSYNATQYGDLIARNLSAGHPVECVVAIYDSNIFPYETGGHYVVMRGTSYNSSQLVYNTIVNDPYPGNPQTYTVPISEMLRHNKAHDNGTGYLIHVVD